MQLLKAFAGWGDIYYKVFLTGHFVHFGFLSIVTVVLFLINSFALLFLHSSKMLYKNLSLMLTLTVLIVSFSLLLGYGFNAPFFYIQNFIPPAFFTLLSFFFLSLACLSASDKNIAFIRKVSGTQTSAKLFRFFLPITLTITIVEGLILVRILPYFNINPAIVVSFVTLFFIVLVGSTITIVSRNIGRSIDTLTENLRISEEKMRVIVEGTPHLFFYTQDINAYVDYVSPTVERITGHTVGEWLNQKHWFITESPINNIAKQRTKASLNGEKNSDPVIVEMKHSDGYPILLEVYEYPIYKNDVSVGIQGVAHDITERKQAETAIIKAKEHAEELSRLKSNFMANMSHELRTPLVGLLGISEFMMSDGKNNENAKIIHNSGLRLLKTINEILNFTKIESEKTVINYSMTNVTLLLKDEIKLYQKMASQKGISINECVPYEDIIIGTDDKMFQEIVDNLLNNAVKFTNFGKVTIVLELKNNEIIIKISDTGIGIPNDKLDIIFEEFRQISEGRNRGFDGSGLGLTIVKKYVQLLNGTISVESEFGNGSNFIVNLPVTDVEKGKITLETNPEQINDNSVFISNDKNHKILLVDDDDINLLTFRKMLEKEYEIIETNNGTEAVEIVKKQKVDIILMDINLKHGLTGIQTTKLIREIKGYENVPIVAITAYAMSSDRNEFLKSGFSHYLAKPFSKNDIIQLLANIRKYL